MSRSHGSPSTVMALNESSQAGIQTLARPDRQPPKDSAMANRNPKSRKLVYGPESLPKKLGGHANIRTQQEDDAFLRQLNGPVWHPNIHASTWIPGSLVAINDFPASIVYTRTLETLDFARYVRSFTGELLLPTISHPDPDLTTIGGNPLPLNELQISNYYSHFTDCLHLERDAQAHETIPYNMFKVNLCPYSPNDSHDSRYALYVPGLQENTPRVAIGDTVMLRQLLIDPVTQLPRQAHTWIRQGPEVAPGFTGVQHAAIVWAVSKAKEILILRIDGLLDRSLCFNVAFPVQDRAHDSLQIALTDIGEELLRIIREEKEKKLLDEFTMEENEREDSRCLPPQLPHYLHSSGTSQEWLRSILFPTYNDGVETTSLPGGTFSRYFFDPQLNYEQRKAVDAIQSQNYGNVPYLIGGPPGTGKTKTIVEAILQIANNSGCAGSILVCAPSDQAADLLALRLQNSLPRKALLRLNHYSRTFEEVPDAILPQCYIENNYFSLPPFDQLMSFKVVVTSCRDADMLVQAKVTNRDLASLQHRLATMINPVNLRGKTTNSRTPLHWEALLLDEAAQATEMEVLIPLSVIVPPAQPVTLPTPMFVMAGDQYQLGPRVSSKGTTLNISLFERLTSLPVYADHPLFRHSAHQGRVLPFPMLRPPFTNLIRNYRSHSAILAVPSTLFYNDTLIPEALDTEAMIPWPGWPRPGWPIMFVSNGGLDAVEDLTANAGSGSGWYNLREAEKATAYARNLVYSPSLAGIAQTDICIMAPSGAQVRLLRKMCRAAGLHGVNVGPMEAFQGLEMPFVIICTTRARLCFVEDDVARGFGMVAQAQKFNVAITRARQGLIVLGNPWVLEVDQVWRAFMTYCWRNGLWRGDREGSEEWKAEGAGMGRWKPGKKQQQGELGLVSGLEMGLVFREREMKRHRHRQWENTSAGRNGGGEVGLGAGRARGLMTASQDDAMWMSGTAAEDKLKQQGVKK